MKCDIMSLTDKGRKFACTQCEYKTPYQFRLKKHIGTHQFLFEVPRQDDVVVDDDNHNDK